MPSCFRRGLFFVSDRGGLLSRLCTRVRGRSASHRGRSVFFPSLPPCRRHRVSRDSLARCGRDCCGRGGSGLLSSPDPASLLFSHPFGGKRLDVPACRADGRNIFSRGIKRTRGFFFADGVRLYRCGGFDDAGIRGRKNTPKSAFFAAFSALQRQTSRHAHAFFLFSQEPISGGTYFLFCGRACLPVRRVLCRTPACRAPCSRIGSVANSSSRFCLQILALSAQTVYNKIGNGDLCVFSRLLDALLLRFLPSLLRGGREHTCNDLRRIKNIICAHRVRGLAGRLCGFFGFDRKGEHCGNVCAFLRRISVRSGECDRLFRFFVALSALRVCDHGDRTRNRSRPRVACRVGWHGCGAGGFLFCLFSYAGRRLAGLSSSAYSAACTEEPSWKNTS